MKIYVDADACPVVAIVEQIAKEYEIPVTLLCDTNHVLYSDYSEVVTVGAGADAVDFIRRNGWIARSVRSISEKSITSTFLR